MSPDRLDAAFAALADPTRRSILARLALGETTVNELAAPFDISLPGISKHLKVLEHAGLISRSRDAQRRPCRIKPETLEEVSAWVETYRQLWEGRFNRLEGYLKQISAKESESVRNRKD